MRAAIGGVSRGSTTRWATGRRGSSKGESWGGRKGLKEEGRESGGANGCKILRSSTSSGACVGKRCPNPWIVHHKEGAKHHTMTLG